MNGDGSIEEVTLAAYWRPYDQYRIEFPRGFHQSTDGSCDAIKQRVLKQQVVDRISRQAELGKNHEGGLQRIALPRKLDCLG